MGKPSSGRTAEGCLCTKGVPPQRQRAKYAELRTLGRPRVRGSSLPGFDRQDRGQGIDKNVKSFSDRLSPEEIKAVAGYIQELAERRSGG
jgi:hypothetical protein